MLGIQIVIVTVAEKFKERELYPTILQSALIEFKCCSIGGLLMRCQYYSTDLE